MHIIHVAPEMAPVAKVGGLGDVVLGLSRSLKEAGHKVEVILPRYRTLDYSAIEDFHIFRRELWSFCGGAWIHNTVWSGWVEGIHVYFIEPHNDSQYFGRASVYGCRDDIERFTYFSRAALEFLTKSEIAPDILHLHEWHTALIAPLYWELYQPLGYSKPALVLTLHNLEHQGRCKPQELQRVGLSRWEQMKDDQRPGMLNILKGGINFADAVTAVSPTYAWEITTELGGHGLDATVRQNRHKLTGILNGLDQTVWDPSADPFLPLHFDAHSLHRKLHLKEQLRERLALSQENRPLVATVARLVPQKGVGLIRHAIFRTLEMGGQYVLLGSSRIQHIAKEFQHLKLHFADNPNLHLELQPHEELTHLIYAGADLFVVPSLFEPCGLTQQIAMKYGTLPLARATGGLKDTVFDADYSSKPFPQRNGFLFDSPTNEALDAALERGLTCWEKEPKRWQQLMRQAMEQDLGWHCDAYLEVYARARTEKDGSAPLPPLESPASAPRESQLH